VLYTIWPKIFEGENFREYRGFLPDLENFILKNFGPSRLIFCGLARP